MTWMMALGLLVTVALTSTLSGVLGMGGGILLMGVFAAYLPLSAAMILHGTTQLAANGSRAVLHRRFISWRVAWPFCLGAFVAVLALAAVQFSPSLAAVYLLLGAFPFAALLMPKHTQLDITHNGHALLGGFIVTGMQIIAGASGPVLDVFFLNDKLSRHQVVATKAMTQCVGHMLKIIYYGGLVVSSAPASLPIWLHAAAVVIAGLGTATGAQLLERLSETRFAC